MSNGKTEATSEVRRGHACQWSMCLLLALTAVTSGQGLVCQPPHAPKNGGYNCHPSPCRRLSHGTVIEFYCDEGYILKGDYKFLTCQYGEWDSPVQISCVKEQGCVRPYMVENSWVNHTETNRGFFPVGTVLQYSCDPGYTPDGPNILTCISPGRWSSEPPHCTQSDACLPLSEPENGGYTCHPSPCRMFSHGTVVEFFCHTGFILKGKYNYLTCQYGQWDGPMQISCVKQGCTRPFMEQHVSYNLMDTNISAFPVGTVLKYRCDQGYQPDGPTVISCTGFGHWSSEPPRCLHTDVCQPPYQPENGGYTCHPSQCRRLSHGTVIEYFCDEGYILKGDYKYLTCQYGKWDGLMQISCVMEQDRGATLPLGMPALSIVSSTASSVALILLLVVLFVLLQPKLKSFHRRDQGVSRQPVSIMVEGVQVNLPSYEEAVSGNTGSASALNPESRVQIVLSEGQQASTPEAGPSRPASLKHLHSEMALVHPLPLSSSSSPSSSSSWTLENAGAAALPPGDHHSLTLLDSEMDCSDDMPLLKETGNMQDLG
uniref:sushi domain-containing protein 4-like n=1 Tax=Doryrhamphus excisus TaxID=161450 RepID=UPI0025AE7634|nr:sushi domain-containing protein 4-like [Doryrhamphus excisus]XP_057947033.1 sushi domain-containing protein 4-like [Doryrhamphus excisus]XP_057947034.1 sushi domain-containing protein 4-like [Doryrhamphus excisus]